MENGNGQMASETVPGRVLWPWQRDMAMTEPAPIAPAAAIEAPAKPAAPTSVHPNATPEGRAKISASMKASHAARQAKLARLQRRADAAAEQLGKPTTSSLDQAISYHQNALNTLLAAKALLK